MRVVIILDKTVGLDDVSSGPVVSAAGTVKVGSGR
jgi:hypothetical protein